MAVARMDLVCEVSSLSYDFDKKSGKLIMAESQSVDMAGCTKLFLAIDPNVQWIETFAGTKPDTIYKRMPDGSWDSALTRTA